MKKFNLRHQLWAITVFVTCALAIFLWTSESNIFLYKMTQIDAGIDQNLQSIASDYDQEDELRRLNYDIITNGSTPRPFVELKLRSLLNVSQGVGNPVVHFVKESIKKSIPPFKWCYHNETMDREIADHISCADLFEGMNGDNETYPDVKRKAKEWKSPCEYTDEEIVELAKDCSKFKESFNFLDNDASEEELNFPLTYVMVAEKWAWQVIRILSSVYRKQNLYCITYDQHSSSEFKKAMNSMAKCLGSNVIMPSEHLEIYWADISLLKSTLNCMQALIAKSDHDWRYVQILSYNDFPLKTNSEMIRILRLFNGANDVELAQSQPERYARYHKLSQLDPDRVNDSRPIPADGIIVYKGSFAATLSRDFVRFVFNDHRARAFLDWSAPTWAPEEQFWSTLVHNEHLRAPGHFPGICLDYYKHVNSQKAWISRYQVWYSGCEGMWTSGSCVFGVGDLPTLMKRPELIAHKFYSQFEPATFYCLAKRHYERTFLNEDSEYANTKLDMQYYENLPAVQYQRMGENFSCGIKLGQDRR